MTHGSGMMENITIIGPFMWVSMAFLLGIGLLGLTCTIKGLTSRTNIESKKHKAPLEILTARYVRGEISTDQFVQMKKDIESS